MNKTNQLALTHYVGKLQGMLDGLILQCGEYQEQNKLFYANMLAILNDMQEIIDTELEK